MPGPPVTGPQSTGGQGVPLTSPHPVYPPPTHGLGNGRAGVPMPQMMPGPPPPVSGPQHGGPQGGPHANVHYPTVQGPTNSRTGVPMSQVMTGPPVSGPQPGGGQGGPMPSVHYQTVQGPGNNRAGVAMVPQQSMRPHTPSSSSGNAMHQPMPVFPHFQPHSAPYFVNNAASVNFVPPASGSNPMLTIPGAAVQSISYTHPQHGHVRMPFQSHHGQHPIYNYSAYHYPVMMTTAGQTAPQVMPTSQNQPPGPPRGQPMPSQSPANVSGTMMPPMSVEQPETRKVPQQVPQQVSQPLKKREKKVALIQDPNTMEIVQLEKLAQSDAPTSKPSTGGSGTSLNVDTTTSAAPSVTPVTTAPSSAPKAETTTESSDKNKNLNSAPDHHVQVEFIEKISKAASGESKSDACKTTETPAVSETESSNRFENVMQDKKSPETKVPETPKDLAQKQELPVKDNSTTMTAADDKVSSVNKDSSLKNLPKVTSPSCTSKILENNTSQKVSSPKIQETKTPTLPAQDSAQQKTLKQTSTDSKSKSVVEAPADSTKVNGEVCEPSTPKTVEEVKRLDDQDQDRDKDCSDTTPSPPSSTSMPSISTSISTAEDPNLYLKGGRYVYTREDLLKFEKAPASHVKPNIDKKIDEVIRAGKKVSLVGLDPFMPQYVVRSGPGRPSMRPSIGQYTGRSSQDMRQQPRKIIPTPSLSQDVKLHTTEHAWKPEVGGQKKAVSTEEAEQLKTKELEKKFRGYLNKITPQKYDVIQDKIQELKIDTEDRLVRVLNLVFDKAVDEPSFSMPIFASTCRPSH